MATELRKEFSLCWNEFVEAVLKMLPQNPGCDDPVMIMMNSWMDKLPKEQLTALVTLSIAHTCIESNYGADAAISVAVTQERIDNLKEIIASLKAWTAICKDAK